MTLLAGFESWVRRLSVASAAVGSAVVVFMMLVVAADVSSRDALDRPILGAFELVEFGMLVAVSSAFCLTQMRGGHLRVDVVLVLMPPRVRAAFESFNLAVMLVFTTAVAWQGYAQSMVIMRRAAQSVMLEIPKWPFYLLLGVGWSILSLAVLAELLSRARSAFSGGVRNGLSGSETEGSGTLL